jgi:DNA-directed RNA polymerase subunit omega
MRLEQTISRALKRVDEDSYLLSLMVAKRADEIKDGSKPLIEGINEAKYKSSDIALMEIADGLVKLDKICDND